MKKMRLRILARVNVLLGAVLALFGLVWVVEAVQRSMGRHTRRISMKVV